MNLIRLCWQSESNININTKPYHQQVLGDPESIFDLWFILKERKEIFNLKGYSLNGIEIDMTKGLNYICGHAIV